MSDVCKMADATIKIVKDVRRADDVRTVSVHDAGVVGDAWEACGKGRYVRYFLVSENPYVCVVESGKAFNR